MRTDELRDSIREAAYLEGDFVLRSGRRSGYYLDKYRFETKPELLEAIGERIADLVAEHEPDADRLAGPELGAVALTAAASISSRLPFLIVRKDAKGKAVEKRVRLEDLLKKGKLKENILMMPGDVLIVPESFF